MKYIFTYIVFFISTVYSTTAQNNKTNITNSYDTCINVTINSYDRLLKYIIPEKQEIINLYKLDLIQLALGRANFAYERKINRNQSFQVSTEFYQMKNNNNTRSYYPIFTKDESGNRKIKYLSLDIEYRFYNNIDKRLQKGKNTNGFSANYWSIGLASHSWFYNKDIYSFTFDDLFVNGDFNEADKIAAELNKYRPRENILLTKFGYGIQRRIGNIGYFESQFKLGVSTNMSFSRIYPVPEVNIKVGFALSSLKLKNKK